MENSFFEYRDRTGIDSGSDSEIIDDSIVESVLFSAKKKNRTAFIAESDESSSNDEDNKENILSNNQRKSIPRHCSTAIAHVISSSEDEISKRNSSRRHLSQKSQSNTVISSSEEDNNDYSPELVPKRAPRQKSVDSYKSTILQRTKKRTLFQDSDTDNSIIIERNKNKKLQCLKDTPLKIEGKNNVVNESTDGDVDKSDDNEESDNNGSNDADDHDSSKSYKNSDNDEETDNEESDNTNDVTDDSINLITKTGFSKNCRKLVINSDDSDDEIITKPKKSDEFTVSNSKDTDNQITDDDDGPDEDMMVMSRATRMSIMGIVPKDNDSDESDFIQSDESSRKTLDGITASTEDLTNIELRPDELTDGRQLSEKLTASNEDLPLVTMPKIPENDNKIPDNDVANISLDSNDSRLTCSPFTSPIQDLTNLPQCTDKDSSRKSKVFNTDISKKIDYMDLTVMQDEKPKVLSKAGVIDLSNIDSKGGWNKVLDESASVLTRKKQQVDNDDVAIIETKPEIIALSSDDEDELHRRSVTRNKSQYGWFI